MFDHQCTCTGEARLLTAAILSMSLFEVVREKAMIAYPDVFLLANEDRDKQKIQERTNRRLDELVLGTVGVGQMKCGWPPIPILTITV